jgi:hypothetical protein
MLRTGKMSAAGQTPCSTHRPRLATSPTRPGLQADSTALNLFQHQVQRKCTSLGAPQVVQMRLMDFSDVSPPEQRVSLAELLVAALAYIAADLGVTVTVIGRQPFLSHGSRPRRDLDGRKVAQACNRGLLHGGPG